MQERYDGMTARDDAVRYCRIFIPISVLIIALIALLIWLNGYGMADMGAVFVADSTPRLVYNEELKQCIMEAGFVPKRQDRRNDVAAIENYMLGIVGDLNRDGETSMEIQIFDVYTESMDLGGNLTRAMGSFADERYCLFFCDEKQAKIYADAEFFDDLSAYGFDTVPGYPQLVSLKECGLFTGSRLENYCAAFIDWNALGKGFDGQTEAAISIISGLVEWR